MAVYFNLAYMQFIPQIIFIVIIIFSIGLFYKNMSGVWQSIHLGKPEVINDFPIRRWKNVFLLAIGQKKLFKNPFVGILHLIIYAGFIIINLEMAEIILDGILGTHRILLPFFELNYATFINLFEILAFSVLIVCVIFLCRRNLFQLKRFQHVDLEGSPKLDANIILITEILLMIFFLLMNASDQALQQLHINHYRNTGPLLISQFMTPFFSNLESSQLIILERIFWWLHILGVFAFLNYLPYSKHLHIILAFPNAYYARLTPSGTLNNMPVVQKEVTLMLHPEEAINNQNEIVQRFGAKDIQDLSWKNLLEAFSCSECGRCTQACPASITGKKLSPRKVMMATRDRAEEVSLCINKQQPLQNNSSSLLEKIGIESIQACTTCNACVEVCPISISPVEIIMELRRGLVMEDSNVPKEWNIMFNNMENNFAPWQFSPEQRDKWGQ